MALQLVWRPEEDYRGPHGIALDGAHRLWRYKRGPSWVRSVLLYNDGESPRAVPTDAPSLDEANAADEFILGGVNYLVSEGSWQHQALVNAGFQFREVGYTERYTEDYPWGN